MSDSYIKLSRIRDDYGIPGRQGTVLNMSELDGFSIEQLRCLRRVLSDECEDIQYQINLELKNYEKDAKWMYGCKNSLKARQVFVQRIDEILSSSESKSVEMDDAERAIAFMKTAALMLPDETFWRIRDHAEKKEVFSVSDIV